MTAPAKLQAQSPAQRLKPGRPLTLAGIADGAEGLVIADLARAIAAGASPPAISAAVICRDGPRLAMLSRALGFFAPDIEILEFPAWDCLPYDRVSPHAAIVAQRMTALARLASVKGRERPAVLLTTVNAILQRVPARAIVGKQSLSAAPGNVLPMSGITHWLELNGFNRASTVREPGDYAVRGGIIDLFAPGMGDPVRLDFFGDRLESIRSFDPETQRTNADLRALDLVPMAEFQLTSDTIRLFRTGYVAAFGAAAPDDVLYEAVSEGRRHAGMEHWLPLFHQRLETLFDYLGNEAPPSSPSPQRGEGGVRGLGPIGDSPGEPPHPNPLPSGERERAATPILLEPLAEEAAHERLAQIADYYQARKEALDQTGAGAPYKPLPPDRLYLAEGEWRERLENVALARLTPFSAPDGTADTIEIAARAGHNFSAERSEPNTNVFEAVTKHVHALQTAGKRAMIALWSEGSRERMAHVLAEHGLVNLTPVASWQQALALPRHEVALAVLGIESGFETADVALISEQDILGERLVRARRQSKRAENFIAEVTSLAAGDLVVHVDHGIGRFHGLRAIEAAGAPHDCLEIHYAGGDKLFLPVENIELLSRFGSEGAGVELDRLGSGAWQARKSRMKNRIREIASALIKIAAERLLHEAPRLTVASGLYDEFCAGFPYEETDDQLAAIAAVLNDLNSGRPMDRLICGDVGFGKTEVALRAAFIAAMNGKQVAVVVPTTLLARQHTKTFTERLRGHPINIAQASRLVSAKELANVKKGIAEGANRHRHRHPCAARQVDQVQGPRPDRGRRRAAFRRRPQGKAQAVARRGPRADADRDADPAHLAIGAVRRARNVDHRHAADRSAGGAHLRLAVRRHRGARGAVARALSRRPGVLCLPAHRGFGRRKIVPRQARAGSARRRGPRPDALDRARRHHERVLRRQVRRAALDHHHRIRPRHPDRQHADRASRRHVRPVADLSAARPGRAGKAARLCAADLAGEPAHHAAGRAPPQGAAIARHARRRLPARLPRSRHPRRRQSVGRGTVRPHQGSRLRALSRDARGSGAEPQSRHQHGPIADRWSPQITIGTAVLIPEDYVADLPVRLALYRRLAEIEDERDIESFGAELVDRFGPLPQEVEYLLQVVAIKSLCRRANVERIEVGPKGAVLAFRENIFANPEGLIAYIGKHPEGARVRPDMKVVFFDEWETAPERLKGATGILRTLVGIAEKGAKAA